MLHTDQAEGCRLTARDYLRGKDNQMTGGRGEIDFAAMRASKRVLNMIERDEVLRKKVMVGMHWSTTVTCT